MWKCVVRLDCVFWQTRFITTHSPPAGLRGVLECNNISFPNYGKHGSAVCLRRVEYFYFKDSAVELNNSVVILLCLLFFFSPRYLPFLSNHGAHYTNMHKYTYIAPEMYRFKVIKNGKSNKLGAYSKHQQVTSVALRVCTQLFPDIEPM